MENEKKEESSDNIKSGQTPQNAPWREIIIKTDGNNIKIEKSEVAGSLELKGILTEILKRYETK